MPQGVSTRWCPTPKQLLILQDMYRAGVRNPNGFQIQQITSHLSYYGKIEGKNVFYWFQNHKARERQKLRKRMLKQMQSQYQLDRFAPTILQLQQQNQNNFFLPHHKHNGENEAGNFMYKMAIPGDEETINKTAAHGDSENQEWFVLQINPERVCREPLKTLDLFPVSKSSLNHFEAEEKDRVATSSTDNSAIPHSSKCITSASSDLCIA